MAESGEPRGVIAAIVKVFLESKLSLILVIASLALGVAAVQVTPREEEPQIVVPLADVFVSVPGAGAKEVEKLVTTPLERILWQVDGVEYVYSVSRRDSALVTVRFFVGEDREASLIKLHNALTENLDKVPDIVSNWLVKPVEIDDVPIVNLTLFSDEHTDHEVRRVAEELAHRLSEVENLSQVDVVSGRPREIRVEIDPERMAGFDLSMLEVARALDGADHSAVAGELLTGNRVVNLAADSFLQSAEEVRELVVGAFEKRPIHLGDIATVRDMPEEAHSYSRINFGDFYLSRMGREGVGDAARPQGYPAVTIALAKKKGTNAVDVARAVIDRFHAVKNSVLPQGMMAEVTRNYGETAQQKVNDLLGSLGFAIVTVVALLAIALGWREALVVALAVPVSFSLALFVNYLLGYTINRVTLFALILSLGLVVDDPITNVDNIQRHILMGKKNPFDATRQAVAEVLPPVIMSTLAIMVSFLPLFFISGMMGPYMAPMAANVPLTVTFSTLCALTIVPWMAYNLLKNLKQRKKAKGKDPAEEAKESRTSTEGVPDWILSFYKKAATPFLSSRAWRWGLVGVILAGLLFSAGLALFRYVPLKMLPFDNKNEFQIIVDMEEGTTLEQTDRLVRELENYLTTVKEVTNTVSYTGTASPMDFNGMVRHYYLRQGGHVADIRVNLAGKDERTSQSHAIVLRLRRELEAIGRKHGGKVKLVEIPPGPPVLSTITTEIYGAPELDYSALIKAGEHLQGIMEEEPFVVDIDDSAEAERPMIDFVLDKEKAGLHGVTAQEVVRTLQMALTGHVPALMHAPDERNPLPVRIILPRERRVSAESLSRIKVKTRQGTLVPLAELGRFAEEPMDQPVYHKNLDRVVFVYAEMAGRAPGEAILDMQARLEDDPLPPGTVADWAGEGEWKITLDVFRDLGIAFAAALVGIYILLVVETASFGMPLLIMSAIPLTLLGIMPGFWLLNLFFNQPVDGFETPSSSRQRP